MWSGMKDLSIAIIQRDHKIGEFKILGRDATIRSCRDSKCFNIGNISRARPDKYQIEMRQVARGKLQ